MNNSNSTVDLPYETFALKYLPGLIICIMGVVTNFISIIVCLNPRLKYPVFKFMLLTSINDCLYCFILAFESISFCNSCYAHVNFYTNVYTVYVAGYISSSLAILNILIELFISLERYLIILNSPYLKQISYIHVTILLMILSFVYYVPVLFASKVVLVQGSGYTIHKTEFGKASGEIILILLQGSRLIISVLIIPLLNTVIIVSLSSMLKKRASIVQSNF